MAGIFGLAGALGGLGFLSGLILGPRLDLIRARLSCASIRAGKWAWLSSVLGLAGEGLALEWNWPILAWSGKEANHCKQGWGRG